MAADLWNREQYERFRDERAQPFHDLLAMVEPSPDMRAVDLGCGTGELTRILHDKLQPKETLGLDSSANMLERAADHACGGLRFEVGDIAAFADDSEGGPFDLIFSNAALQWLPGHEELFAKIAARVAEGGQFAVQMPANNDHPSHAAARQAALEEPFREAQGGQVREWWVLKPEEYAAMLHRLGFARQSVRLQVYPHVLESRAAVVEWTKGTLLRDYEKRLSAELFPAFLERYRERLFEMLPDEKPFFYPFKRILMWARR